MHLLVFGSVAQKLCSWDSIYTLYSLQSVNSVFLSHQISSSYQPPASQQYFSRTINQHQPQHSEQSDSISAEDAVFFELVLSHRNFF